MPTKHPRIAVTRDSELSRALDQTRELLGARESGSLATHLRTLALLGARAVIADAGPQHELRRNLVDRYGTRPAGSSLGDLELPPEPVDPANPTPASDALRWARGD